jgi:hypothetical protein
MKNDEEVKTMGKTKHSPLRAIRAKCIDCSGGSRAEVRRCTVTDCSLYPYRMGKNPYHGLSTRQRKGSHSRKTKENVGVS